MALIVQRYIGRNNMVFVLNSGDNGMIWKWYRKEWLEYAIKIQF